MDKKVKEVFFNIANEENKFCEAKLEEVKFSKKLNAVIISATSDNNISLYDIEDFEKRACKEYELNSFKIDYKYIGNYNEITLKNIQNIILIITKKYEYTKKIFENCKINIDNEAKIIEIVLAKKFADFLAIKKIDKYINKCIDIEYGSGYTVVIKDAPNIVNNDENNIAVIKLDDLVSRKSNEQQVTPAVVSPQVKNTSENRFPIRQKLTPEEKEERKLAKMPQPENVIYGINITTTEKIKVEDINTNYERVCFDGEIFKVDSRELKSGKILLTLDVTDYTSTIACKLFLDKEKYEEKETY